MMRGYIWQRKRQEQAEQEEQWGRGRAKKVDEERGKKKERGRKI